MNREDDLQQKYINAIGIILLYRLGCCLVLPWLDVPGNQIRGANLESYLTLMTGADFWNGTIFSLGIMPYITASILVQFYYALSGKSRRKFSRERIQNNTRILMFFIALAELYFIIPGYHYRWDMPESFLQAITGLSLLFGVFFVAVLMELNEKKGFGGSSIIILTNMLSGVGRTLIRPLADDLTRSLLSPADIIFCLFSILIVIITVFLEHTELRLPVLRVSIHNEYQADDYIAIKWNPAGTMPAMYVMLLFSLPALIFRFFERFFPELSFFGKAADALNLDSQEGVFIFLVMMVAVIFLSAWITLSPDRISENLQKNGDYLDGVRAGRETRSYLAKRIFGMCCLSSVTMCLLTGIPLLYRLKSDSVSPLFMAPVSLMIMTDVFGRLYEQVRTEQLIKSYQPFL